MALLEVRGVSKSFAGLRALDGVDLTVAGGTVHAIIGPNGAGKSTLLNVLTGRLRPDRGAVLFDGRSLIGMAPHLINQLGVARVFQTPQIYPEMSCLENVVIAALASRDGAFALNLFQHPRRLGGLEAEAQALLERVGIGGLGRHEARSLSRGDKRSLEIAICLAQRPKLLLLDEPTAGMSHFETKGTTELLKRIAASGMTKIIIEHDMDVVFALSDRITVLHQGRVIAEGTPDEIRANAAVEEAYLGGLHL
jgi:branched-chain amino acid transport system ATP-binding protein